MRTLAFVVIGLASCISCCRIRTQSSVQIYYIPFDVETYTPVSRNDIQARAQRKTTVSASVVEPLTATLEAARIGASFDDHKVRLRVATPKCVYDVDSRAVVITSDGGHQGDAGGIEREVLQILRTVPAG